MFKVQFALAGDVDQTLVSGIPGTELLSFHKNGKVAVAIMRGDKDAADSFIKSLDPLLYELLPLTLEEVFSFEMDSFGYHFDEIL